MTVSLRAAHPSQPRISLAAVRSHLLRSSLLLMLLALFGVFGSSVFAQGLSPGGPVNFGNVDLHNTTNRTLTFTGPIGGTTVTAISVVTDGVAAKDFTLVSDAGCIGTIAYPEQCSITLAFSPKQIGLRSGALTITDSSGAIVNLVYLSGVGLGPQFVFQPATATTLDTGSGLTPATFTAGSIVSDPNGDIIFTDVANNRILEETSTGLFSVLYSGSPLALTSTSGLAIDGAGNIYVSSGALVYALAPGATTLTVLPTPGITLVHPTGLAVDAAGDLYIADSSANKIYQDVLDGNFAQALTLTGTGATLTGPTGLAIDDNNNLYVANSGGNSIVEISLTTLTTTYTATTLSLTSLTLNDPTGVTVDPAGTIYIADTGNNRVVEATVPGDQFVLIETPPLTLDTPAGILIEANGDMVIADTTLGLVTIPRSTPFVNFPTPTIVGTLDSTDDPETLTVQESGNLASTLEAGTDPAFSGTNPTAFLLATTGNCPSLTTGEAVTAADTFAIGQVCTYNLNFQPTVDGPNLANLVLSTTAAGGLTSTSTASLKGIGLSTLNHFTLVASTIPATTPTTVNLGGSVQLVLTAIQSDGSVATDYVGTITFTTTDANGVYQGGTGAGTNTTTYTITAADKGVLVIPVASGLQLNQYGIFTATATADPATVPPGASGVATSNNIFVIEPATLKLTSSINPSLVNQSTNFTLTVTTTGTVVPAGTVSFFNGTTLIGTETLSPLSATSASATIPDSFPTAGSYPITATYTSTSNTQGGTASLTQVVGNATSLTLTSSINPSLVGQSTNLTATIMSLPAFGSPTGHIQFFDGATSLGTVAVTGSSATLPASFSTAGTHTLTAVYTSTNVNILGATSGPYSQVVLNVAALSLTSSVNPSLPNQSTTLTATLTALGSPTGTIKFYDGTTLLGTVNLTGTTATLAVSFSTTGTHTLTAVYSGNTLTESVTSPPLLQIVQNTSSITLTSSVNPVAINANTTLTATIASTGIAPTGTVTFKSNGVTIGTGNVNGGVATLVTSFPAAGVYTLTAVYSGDTNNSAATSAPYLQTVLNPVTVTLTSSVNPVNVNANTTLTATVASAGTPTGTVTFKSNGVTIGTGNVTGGVATLVTSFAAPGTYTLTAVYSGDSKNQTATSAPYLQKVLNLVIITLSSTNNPVFLDNPTVITAALTTVATGPTPTGTVSFFDGTTPIGTGTVANGILSITATFVYAGTHSITAVYSGDTSDAPVTSAAFPQTVADFSLTVATGGSNSASTIAGGGASYSLVVTPIITSTLPAAINLTVTGLPTTVTGTLTPSSIAAGSGTTPVAFAVLAASLLQTSHVQQRPPHHSLLGYAPATLAFLVLPLAWSRRRKRFGTLLASLCLLVVMTAGLTGCISAPSSGYYGQTPQTYNLTVTATSGNLSRSTYLTLTVQ